MEAKTHAKHLTTKRAAKSAGAKKPPKPNPKFVGAECPLCGRAYVQHQNTGKWPRFITHHLCYEPEITAVVCLSCHNWMSGNGRVYNHPLKPRDMTPAQRATGPFWFAVAVVDLYDKLLIQPQVVKELQEQAIAGVCGKGTLH